MSICSESPSAVSGGQSGCTDGKGFMLFGVRVQVDPMRKCVSMNNLSEYTPVVSKELLNSAAEGGGAAGYVSADDAVPPPSTASAERKRGVPWTEEEHKLFLIGLQKVGKGDWRGISRNYVKTRTPTQVASHAQKYFLRRSNLNRCRRRSSLFDITTDSVNAMPMEEIKSQENGTQVQPGPNQNFVMLPVTSHVNGFSIIPSNMTVGLIPLSMENSSFAQTGVHMNNSSPILVHQVPFFPVMPTQSGMVEFNLNQQVRPLCLKAFTLVRAGTIGY